MGQPIEALSDVLALARWNAAAGVLDRDEGLAVPLAGAHGHGAAGRRVFERVVDEIAEEIVEERRIRRHGGGLRLGAEIDLRGERAGEEVRVPLAGDGGTRAAPILRGDVHG